MKPPAAFRATVQSYRSAASRGMFQIVLEVPEEQTPQVTAIAPRGSWVAVAALAPEAAAPATSGQEREAPSGTTPPPPAPPLADAAKLGMTELRALWATIPAGDQKMLKASLDRRHKPAAEQADAEATR